MPPLQHPSTLDPTAVIPFSDHASPFDNLFDSDLATQQPQPLSFAPSYQQQQLQVQQQPALSHNINSDTIPSEADISALFGLTPSQAPVPVHTSAAVSTPAPRHLTTSPSPPRPSLPSTLAPLAPVAHYSSLQHNHLSQEKSLITPIPTSPTVYNGSAPPALTSYTPTSSNAYHTSPTTNAVATKRVAHHRYLTYDTTTYDQAAQQTYTAEPQEQQHYQLCQSSAPYQQYNTHSDYSQHGYSYTVDDISSKNNRATAANPLMLHAPSRSIFSRFGGGGASSGLSTESQSAFAPKFKVAASYVSSTLAVTSTFASEKLATASTKIADLWQHNQHSLPQQQTQQQQQQQPQPHFQQQQQNDALYNHGQYYGTPPEAPSTINSDHFSNNQSDMQQQQSQYSYEGQGLNTNPTFNSNYQSSYNNNNNNSNTPSGVGSYKSNNSNNVATSDYSTRNPFASTASSTLSNAASVAGSYLPSLSKLPALPALSALPALRGLPALPWVGRDKNQQLPQQQPLSDQQYHQYSVDQKQSSDAYYGSYAPSQDPTYQQAQDQQQQQQQQGQQQGHGYHYNAADWWGGIRNEVQKGRRMVQTGVQVGVAWWWDSSEKNPLGGVV